MADRIKDAEDRMLEAMFESEPIPDAGFSAQVTRRIRRRVWVRRLALPIATVIGTSIAAGPMVDLAQLITSVANVVPQELLGSPAAWLPHMNIVLLAGMIAATAYVGAQALWD